MPNPSTPAISAPAISAPAISAPTISAPTISAFLNRLHLSGNKSKVVVVDVDETIGYFVQLGLFCDALTRFAWNNDVNMQYTHFNALMDAFPEFLRPHILELLHFLKLKKAAKECAGVLVYTNNCGPRIWVEHITRYIESKLGEPLFDQIVAAFKVNGQIIEVGRTTNDKTYDDLLRCTKLPSNVEVCFLDDQLHAKMEHARVYYINVKPYVHHLSADTMLNRFLQTPALRSTIRPPSIANSTLSGQILNFMRKFSGNHAPKHPLEQEVDAIISKKIMEHLKTFFLQKMKSIRKTATSLKMKTPAQSKTMKTRRF
jgi:hypothetical protein